MNWVLHRKAVTESTNADARAGAPGDVYLADFQTSGRGRLDHRWLSPPEANLMFSAVLDAAGRSAAEVATLPLVVGLAVVRAAERLLEAHSVRPPLALKWPNDVLANGRKLAGILCERSGDAVIAGVGINVNQREFAPELADRATALAVIAARPFDRDAVLDAVLESLFAEHARWAAQGFAAIFPDLARFDHLAGQVISVRQTDADPVPATGVCGGIQADGSLLVGDRRIYAGEAHVISHQPQHQP